MAVVSLGALFVSAACSFSTDGITFVPDDEFDAVAGGTSRSGSAGKGSGGKGSAGAGSGGTSAEAGSDSAGEAGEIESGGTAGLGVGGKAGLGGGGKGGSLNTAGSGVGGMIVGTAGNLHSAGAPGAGSGGQGPMPTVFPCAGDTLADKLIADFTGITQPGREWKAGVKGDTLFSVFGFPDPANGKPNVKLGTDDLTVEAFGVLQPVGAGIRISPCVSFKGAQSIGFTMSGATKSGDIPVIALRIYTNQNLPVNGMMREGMCLVPTGQDPILFCQPAHVDFPLPATPTRLEFKFVDFKGGKPSDSLQVDQIKRIEWAFTSGPVQKPYDGNYTLDDVLLYY